MMPPHFLENNLRVLNKFYQIPYVYAIDGIITHFNNTLPFIPCIWYFFYFFIIFPYYQNKITNTKAAVNPKKVVFTAAFETLKFLYL